MIEFPENLADFIQKYLKSAFYRKTKWENHIQKPFNDKDLRFFAKGAAELSKRFTSERRNLRGDYLNNPSLRAGYLLYFLPINFAKASYSYQKFPADFWKRKTFRILDLGCGPGTASLAFLNSAAQFAPKSKLEFHWIDQNRNILQDGKNILEGFANSLKPKVEYRLNIISQSLNKLRLSGKYDLIIFNHVLNEMTQWGAQERAEWLHPLIARHLKNDGIFSVLEPALKRPSRELMALRDHLLENLDLMVLAPCLHDSTCPMLAATRNDWCHFYLDWNEPTFLKKLDRILKNENRFLKLSYLLLGSKSAFEKNRNYPKDVFRMVSNRMATRGKIEAVLCGAQGRIHLTRLDRDASPKNHTVKEMRRGDLIRLPKIQLNGYQVAERRRLTKQDEINFFIDKKEPL